MRAGPVPISAAPLTVPAPRPATGTDLTFTQRTRLEARPAGLRPLELTETIMNPLRLLPPSLVLILPANDLAALEIGTRKQLFVDDYLVAEMHNVTREAGQAEKQGVVLAPTLPTDYQSGEVHDGPDGGGGAGRTGAGCWSN